MAVCDKSQEAKGYRCKQSKWLLYSRYHSNLPGGQRSVHPYSRSRLQKPRRSSIYYCNQPEKLITKGQDNPRMPNIRHLLSRISILFRRRRQCLPAEVRTEMTDQESTSFYTLFDWIFELSWVTSLKSSLKIYQVYLTASSSCPLSHIESCLSSKTS